MLPRKDGVPGTGGTPMLPRMDGVPVRYRRDADAPPHGWGTRMLTRPLKAGSCKHGTRHPCVSVYSPPFLLRKDGAPASPARMGHTWVHCLKQWHAVVSCWPW